MILWKDDEGCFSFPIAYTGDEGTAGRFKNAGLKGIALNMVWSLGLPSSTEKILNYWMGSFWFFHSGRPIIYQDVEFFCNSMQRQENLCKAAAKQMGLVHCWPFFKVKVVNSALFLWRLSVECILLQCRRNGIPDACFSLALTND